MPGKGGLQQIRFHAKLAKHVFTCKVPLRQTTGRLRTSFCRVCCLPVYLYNSNALNQYISNSLNQRVRNPAYMKKTILVLFVLVAIVFFLSQCTGSAGSGPDPRGKAYAG